MFDIRDANGWTGVEAEDLASARRACEVISQEGYELPLEIVPPGSEYAVCTLVGFDERGGSIWSTNDTVRRWAA